jgi:hypothetical protein
MIVTSAISPTASALQLAAIAASAAKQTVRFMWVPY